MDEQADEEVIDEDADDIYDDEKEEGDETVVDVTAKGQKDRALAFTFHSKTPRWEIIGVSIHPLGTFLISACDSRDNAAAKLRITRATNSVHQRIRVNGNRAKRKRRDLRVFMMYLRAGIKG